MPERPPAPNPPPPKQYKGEDLTMKPEIKRLLATLVVAIVGAVLPILTKTGQDALPALASVISSVSLAVAYYVKAWGVTEGVVVQVLNGKIDDATMNKALDSTEPKE